MDDGADGTGREGTLMELSEKDRTSARAYAPPRHSFKSRDKFASGNNLVYHSTLAL
jgi:hypothetical protein